jgi:hypothetical protein
MDAIKLKSSCICGNTQPYAECCGLYAQAPDPANGNEAERKWADFRHALHELYMYLFPLRNLYQAYWEKLSQDNYPHHLLMADPDYGRAIMANFFWDYSVQFSDARPILRAARDIEGKQIRLANDLRQWSLSPMWLGHVVEADDRHGYIKFLESEKPHRVIHGGGLPEPGTYVAVRLLAYRGEEYLHPTILAMPHDTFSEILLEKEFEAVCELLRLKTRSGLRPDVQCEAWRRHGALFLGMWRERAYDAVVGVPSRTVSATPAFNLPVADADSAARQLAASGAVALGKGRFEVRYRALSLARLEIREGAVQGALMDDAFRPYVLRWLADHLGAVNHLREEIREDGVPLAFGEALEGWMHMPLTLLNGESPLQAIQHDFGRRKLKDMLQELSRQGRDVSALRNRLGL